MRVGGPYQVSISYIGYETKKVTGITLQLGETYNLSTAMNEDAKVLGDVVVIGKGSKFANEKTGAATNISNAQITNMPSISRSITDYTRLSPYGGNGMTFAGQDGRTANFTVDGASFNNNFGLSSNLPGGGNPISIEAIEEMQVVISPFDVRQTGFIGGGVNAITKSGTNTFQGSAYIYHQNENMRGDAIEGEQISGAREKDRKTTYGFTLGGPIVKDKLFLFVNGEVSKIFTVMGVKGVMIRHGQYISVYCNLSSVNVHVGQSVSTGQSIGAVDGNGVLQFQLHKGFTKLNPEAWLR